MARPKKSVGNGAVMSAATSNAAINATIKMVRTTGTKFNELVQKAIEQIIAHGKEYGDVTGAARLVDAMPQSTRRNEVVNHFGDYSPIRIVKDQKTGLMKASLRKPDDAGYNDWNMDGVKANPWFKRENLINRDNRELTAFDFDAADKRVVDLADFLSGKAVARNVKESYRDPDTGENITNDKTVVKDEDRDALHAMAEILREVARDPKDAAKRLGLSADRIKALGGKVVEVDARDPAMEDTGDEARTGTNG